MTKPALGYLLIHGTAGVLGFLTYFLFSRVVPPSAYADYALIVAMASAFNAFFYSWIGISVNRFFPNPLLDQARYISSIVVTFAIISSVIVLVQLAMMLLWPRPLPTLALIAGPVITVLGAWFHLSLELARARMQIANYGIKSLLRAALLLIAGTSLALAGWGASGLLIGFSIGLLAAGLSSLHRDLKGFALKAVSFAPIRELYAYGWPLAICLGLSWVVALSDRYLVYWLISDQAAGQYALAADFAAQPVWLALLASSRAVLPLTARAYELSGEQAAKAILSQNLGFMLMVGLPVVALEVIAAPQLSSLFLGEAYVPAASTIMPVVAIASLLEGLRAFHLDTAVHLAKRTRVLIGLWALAASANVLLNLLLIPRFGIIGAAWSTLIAHALAVIYFLLWVPRPAVLGLDGRDLLKIAGALAVFAGLLLPIRLSFEGLWFFVGAGVAGLTYGAICWMLNPLDLRVSFRRWQSQAYTQVR